MSQYPHLIPVRTTSKGAGKCKAEDISEEKLNEMMKRLEKELAHERKKIRAERSFDYKYWTSWAAITEKQLHRDRLFRRKSVASFIQEENGREEDFDETEVGRKCIESEKALEVQARKLEKQAKRVRVEPGEESGKVSKGLRRYFMQLYTTSKRGLGIRLDEAGRGNRDPSAQSNFRKEVEAACRGRKYPNNPKWEELWCPVMNTWYPPAQVNAVHIFPWSQGQEAMDQIFGRPDPNRPEMFTKENGILLSNDAEKMIAQGHIVIVPSVSDAPSHQEVDAWSRSEPKRYKIRVIDPKSSEMQKYYPLMGQKMDIPRRTWAATVDGRELEFSSDHRPRARYFYWQYCVSMLKHSWRSGWRKGVALKGELGNRFWGTRGHYMNHSMLETFVDEMGHEFDSLMEGAMPAEDGEANPIGLIAATNVICETANQDPVTGDDDEDEEDEDEEDEDEDDEDNDTKSS